MGERAKPTMERDLRRGWQPIDLVARTESFLSKREKKIGSELAMKYAVPKDEVAEEVRSYLDDAFGPAKRLAFEIGEREGCLLLFIGKKDCNVCKRCEPVLEGFLKAHSELQLLRLDYSEPEGLLYHIIHEEERGSLPMIAFISQGRVWMVFTGECSKETVYEDCYREMLEECSQNIYAH